MQTVTANDLKTKGIAALENGLAENDEAVITVRGKERFIVMDIDHYQQLREFELEMALVQARADVVQGDVIIESVEEHIKRLTDGL